MFSTISCDDSNDLKQEIKNVYFVRRRTEHGSSKTNSRNDVVQIDSVSVKKNRFSVRIDRVSIKETDCMWTCIVFRFRFLSDLCFRIVWERSRNTHTHTTPPPIQSLHFYCPEHCVSIAWVYSSLHSVRSPFKDHIVPANTLRYPATAAVSIDVAYILRCVTLGKNNTVRGGYKSAELNYTGATAHYQVTILSGY